MLFKSSYILFALVATAVAVPLEARRPIARQIKDVQADEIHLQRRHLEDILVADGLPLEARADFKRFAKKVKAKVLSMLGVAVQESKNRVRPSKSVRRATRTKQSRASWQASGGLMPHNDASPPRRHSRGLDFLDDELYLEARGSWTTAKQIAKQKKNSAMDKLRAVVRLARNKANPSKSVDIIKPMSKTELAKQKAQGGILHREVEPFELEFRELERDRDEDDSLYVRDDVTFTSVL